MSIRPFEIDDYLAVIDVYAHSKLDELSNEHNQFKLLPLDKDKKRLAELQESDIYVFDCHGVVAYGAVYQSEVRALFVHPNSRGKGIGKKLFQFLLNTLTPCPIHNVISLYVAKTNENAKALYEQFGFKVTEEFEAEYNGVPVLANKMQKSI